MMKGPPLFLVMADGYNFRDHFTKGGRKGLAVYTTFRRAFDGLKLLPDTPVYEVCEYPVLSEMLPALSMEKEATWVVIDPRSPEEEWIPYDLFADDCQ